MDEHRGPLLCLPSPEQEDQHICHVDIFCENASKRIKLDTVLQGVHEDGQNGCNNEDYLMESELDDEIPNHKNPFLFAPVLSVLFSHMDINTLKKAREVCHLWKDESLSIFKEKTEAVLNLEEICHASCDHRKVNTKICLEFLAAMEGCDEKELPFENLCINMMDMRCNGRMSKIFRRHGSKISSLNIMFCHAQNSEDDDDYNLDCFFKPEDFKLILLYWCTKLKSLKLINIPFSIAESSENIFSVKELTDRKGYIPGGPVTTMTKLELVDDREYFPLEQPLVYHIFKVSPQLSSVKIDVEDEDAFDSFMDGLVIAKSEGLLPNLNSLIFGTRFGCIFYESHLVSLIAMKLHKLKRLEILNMGQDVCVETLNKLFLQCKDYLEVFRLDVTPYSDRSQFPSQFLRIPNMKNLKHLEIKCESIQLSEDINLIRQFPNLKTCTLDTDCNCGYRFTGNFWHSITLKCSQDNLYSRSESVSPILFNYKAHCVRIFERIRKWFPNAKSLYANKCEDRFGLVDLFRAISESNIEELYLEVCCPKSHLGHHNCKNPCRGKEQTEVDKLLLQIQTQEFSRVREKSTAPKIFPDLWKLNIISNGCLNISIEDLRHLGILHLVEHAPVLTEFTIKYCFNTCSKTAIIFDHKEPLFEAEQ